MSGFEEVLNYIPSFLHANRLKSGSQQAERDIVQFVPFREFSHVS